MQCSLVCLKKFKHTEVVFVARRRSRVRYGKPFRSRKGKLGRYKYVNGRRVAFVMIMQRFPDWTQKGGGPYKGRAMVRRYKKRVRR